MATAKLHGGKVIKQPLLPPALLLILAVQTLWATLRGPQTIEDLWVLQLLFSAVTGVGLVLALSIWRRSRKTVYLLFLLAFAAQFGADTYLISLDMQHVIYPEVSVADLLYMGYYVMMLGALLLFLPPYMTVVQQLGRVLDGLIVAGTVGVLLWQLILSGLLGDTYNAFGWLNLTYVLLDLLILGISLVLLQIRSHHKATLLLSAGLIAFVTADMIYLAQGQLYEPGHPLDLLWSWGVALQTLALWSLANNELPLASQRTAPPKAPQTTDQLGTGHVRAESTANARPTVSRLPLPLPPWLEPGPLRPPHRRTLDSTLMTLPYIAALLACLSLAVGLPTETVRSQGVLWGTLVVLTLATVRHWLTTRENSEIARELRENRAKLEYLAYHDYLTGLPNRAALTRFFEYHLANDQTYAIFSLDLNGFKKINDTHGHTAGDRMLKHAAEQLQHSLHPPSLAFRWGGDEFVVVVPDLSDENTAEAVAAQLLSRVERPLSFGGSLLSVSSSVGYALGRGPHGYETSLALADQKMYGTKRSRR